MSASWLRVVGVVSVAVAAGAFLGCGSENFNGSTDGMSGDDVASDELGSDENASLDESDYGTASEALMSCSNPDGTNSVMAALAVAVAQQLGRWNATKDLDGTGSMLILRSGSDASGPIGKSRCADGTCARVQALLDLQQDAARGKVYIQGTGSTKVLLDPPALRSRMLAKWNEQRVCDSAARNGPSTDCTTEQNKLTYLSAAAGGCDMNFTFAAKTASGGTLQYINQLRNELKFADSANPYINFTNLGNGNVSIDPTYGLDDPGTSSTGSCSAACTKISTTSLAGSCCSCGGVSKLYSKAAWNASTFLCL
jgi:hypothetical protein